MGFNSKKSQNNLDLNNRKKFHFKMISAFSMLMLIIAIIVVISWILKWANVSTNITEDGVTTKQHIKAIGIFDIFLAPMQGFNKRWQVIIFILMLGAFINILICSKSLEGFSQIITYKLKGNEVWAIIPLMAFFSVCGTTEGMAEESLGFYMICIPLMMSAGFDKITGFFIVMIGAGIGTLASTVNPFAIGLAVDSLNQGSKASVTSVGDGLVWRFLSWAILTSIAILFVFRYAWNVKKNPSKSVVFSTMEEDKKFFLSEQVEKIEMNWRRKLTLVTFAITFLIMIVYLVNWDSILGYKDVATDSTTWGPMRRFQEWIITNVPYITGVADGFGLGGLETVGAIFLIGSIVLGIINCRSESKFLKEFMTGAGDILTVCLIVATAAGVGWVLEKSFMQPLIVNGLANSIGGFSSPILIIVFLYILFIPLSFIIPSTSGFAGAVFPLLGGVAAKNLNVIPSGSITAFSFASGLVNFITPTSGVVMGALTITRIDFGRYLKIMMPFIGIIALASVILVAIGGAIAGIPGAGSIA